MIPIAKDGKWNKGGRNFEYECIMIFSETDVFNDMSTVYGLDFEVLVNLFEYFASHINISKTSLEKYHEPFKDVSRGINNIDKEICVSTCKHFTR